ncbi:hypothetical protein F2P79_005149 [Pimephales promelas]|nr:hypothetical protein F2P79_005149 [Pimephales promelas]
MRSRPAWNYFSRVTSPPAGKSEVKYFYRLLKATEKRRKCRIPLQFTETSGLQAAKEPEMEYHTLKKFQGLGYLALSRR